MLIDILCFLAHHLFDSFRRISTESATKWLARLDQSGVPVLLCLTHADKFYANQCLRVYGDNCTDNIASRVIGKEMEVIYSFFITFCFILFVFSNPGY